MNDALHGRYIASLLKEAGIIFTREKVSDSYYSPSHFKIRYCDNCKVKPCHVEQYISIHIVWRSTINDTDKFKIEFKSMGTSRMIYLGDDDLSDPNAYKWLIDLVKMALQSYQIMRDHKSTE